MGMVAFNNRLRQYWKNVETRYDFQYGEPIDANPSRTRIVGRAMADRVETDRGNSPLQRSGNLGGEKSDSQNRKVH